MILAAGPWRYRLWGVTSMLLGSMAVFTFLWLMNVVSERVDEQSGTRPIEFQVASPPPPRPKPVPKKTRPPAKKLAPPSVPSALLNSQLSGLDLGLESFSADEIGRVDQSLLGDVEQVVMTSDMVDVPPRPRQRMPVIYPARAKAKDIEGYVVVSLLIDKRGRVETVKVLESDPAGVFDKSAVRSVKKWLFEPARYKGKPVDTWATQTIRFELG